MANGNLFKGLRIALLLYVLAMVATGAFLARARSTDWNDTLWLALYPVAAPAGSMTEGFIDTLSNADFSDIEHFLQAEAQRYDVALEKTVKVHLGEVVATPPPQRPRQHSALANAYWSLKLRLWAWRAGRSQSGPAPDIRIFLVYHDPGANTELPHSVGLKSGLLGIAHLFADRRAGPGNNIVIAHELLHTLGATDKYDPETLMPVFPDGYANPEAQPLLPQKRAEIMAGRVPLDAGEALMPGSLKEVVIGPATASEIRLQR
jgi:hypothetical protein